MVTFMSRELTRRNYFKTSDGCASWIEANYNGSCTVLKCFNEEIILLQSMACNPQCVGTIHKTTDGGGTWTESHSGDGWGNDFEFMPGDASKVFFTDYDSLFFSSDTGKTWRSVFVDTTELQMRDIVFTDSIHGWILGDDGKLFKTNIGGVVTGVDELIHLPIEFTLFQNYPNPFNPSTKISWQSPVSSWQTLKIYDLLGNEVVTLLDEYRNAGSYVMNFDASSLASGIYFYQLRAGSYSSTKKLILMK